MNDDKRDEDAPENPRAPDSRPPEAEQEKPPIQVSHPADWPGENPAKSDDSAAGEAQEYHPFAATADPDREPRRAGVPLRTPQADRPESAAPAPAPASSPGPIEVQLAPRPQRRGRPLWQRLVLGLLKLSVAAILLSILWVALYAVVPPPITLTMVGDMVGGNGARREWRAIERIDADMARAVIGAEDSNFCSHSGFDWEAMRKAYARNQKGGRIRGGSTISQQTAKNVFLWQGGGYFRKGLEAWFTMLIEGIWGKKRIMEVYLNVAETGIGTYGVEAGAQRYFGHGADRLTTREAAQIAAVLPLPKKRAGTNPTGFTRRYANSIAGRIATVRAQGLDSCLR